MTKIHLVQSPVEWAEMIQQYEIASPMEMAIDVETTPVPWYVEEFSLLTVAFSWEEGEAWVVPVSHPETAPRMVDQVIRLREFVEEINFSATTPVMQNGQFDILALRQFGVELPCGKMLWWEDTLVLEYVMDTNRSKSLPALAKRYLFMDDWKDIDYKAPEEEPLDVLARLNGRDADITLRVYKKQMDELNDAHVLLYNRLLMPAVYTVTEMEWDGIPIDTNKLWDTTTKYQEEIDEILGQLRARVDNPKFNPNSYKQLGKFLYDDLGLPITVWTDTGNPSTSAEALKKIAKFDPVVETILRYKKLLKLTTASLLPWQNLERDGKLHPRYKPAMVKTGRLSSEQPNIQQVPRGELRSLFGGVPGHKMVEIDFSQMELRVVAYLAGEETMLDAFRSGKDLHQVTADAFGVDRQTAKALNFGLLYGAGPRKLMWIAEEQYGVKLSEDRATALRNAWFAKYPAIARYHADAISDAHKHGGVYTRLGRFRALPELESSEPGIVAHGERQAINTPVQSLASDITLYQLNGIFFSGLAQPVATVHDSIVFLIPDEEVDDVVPRLRDRMEDLTNFAEDFGHDLLDLPLQTDCKIGDYWT